MKCSSVALFVSVQLQEELAVEDGNGRVVLHEQSCWDLGGRGRVGLWGALFHRRILLLLITGSFCL